MAQAEQWLKRSRGLQHSADLLAAESLKLRPTIRALTSDDREVPDELQDKYNGYVLSMQMLYGLSIETALKAYLIANRPDTIEIVVSTDGRGSATDAKLRQIGATGDGHNLVALASVAGLLSPAHFNTNDIELVKSTLKHLSVMIRWKGRYPAPLKAGDDQDFDLEGALDDEQKPMDYTEVVTRIISVCTPEGGAEVE